MSIYINKVSYIKRSILLLPFCLLVVCSTALQAQEKFGKLEDWLIQNTSKMGGRAILLVYKDGNIVYQQSVNDMSRRQKMAGRIIARRQGKEMNTSDYSATTRQPIASCSKWLSAALVMTFVDEGLLKTDDTVGTWLPVLSQHGKGNITIGQCLSHLTGIKAPPLKESLQEMKDMQSMDEAISNIAVLPMEGVPGKVFHYSNTGLQIAGAVIEKISGQSFKTLFDRRIAGPLGMKNTDFGKGKVALPAGGAVSTPEDYMHFLAMIMNKGVYNGKRILSEHSIDQMQLNRLSTGITVAYSPAEAGDFGYGYGEWVMEQSKTAGISAAVTSPGLFGSFPWVNNEKKYAAFLMTFYLKSEGRNERNKELKHLVDEAVQ